MNKQTIKTARFLLEKTCVIFFVIIVGVGLMVSVITLTSILNGASDSNSNSLGTDLTTFDQLTIDKINVLQNSTDNTVNDATNTNRSNPFSE